MKALTPGDRIGHYEVEGVIGSGGMGEVYRAHDTSLGRPVALKVLPPRFAGDQTRLARVQREARALATVNHPNIATIYGLVDSSSGPALVLEFVDGITLADRLDLGPMAIAETLRVSRQIAEALEAAHEHGIGQRRRRITVSDQPPGVPSRNEPDGDYRLDGAALSPRHA